MPAADGAGAPRCAACVGLRDVGRSREQPASGWAQEGLAACPGLLAGPGRALPRGILLGFYHGFRACREQVLPRASGAISARRAEGSAGSRPCPAGCSAHRGPRLAPFRAARCSSWLSVYVGPSVDAARCRLAVFLFIHRQSPLLGLLPFCPSSAMQCRAELKHPSAAALHRSAKASPTVSSVLRRGTASCSLQMPSL